jgi:TIR domain
MPYLDPHFDPDVFVSYSHGDPQGGTAPLRDWTRNLIDRLREGLHALETEFDGLDIWMDPQKDPTAQLTDELRAKASRCAVLMIVMPNRYLKSSWCKDELDWFRAQAQARPGENSRVFVLRAQKTDESIWPEFLRDSCGHAITGFTFHDPEIGEPWGFQLENPGDEFFRELARLRNWLTKRLHEVRDRAAKRAEQQADADTPAPPPPPGSKRRVYVHAPLDTEAVRAEIDTALEKDGIVPFAPIVGAGKSLAEWQNEAKQLRAEAARRCQALALVRVPDGGRFVGDLLDTGVDERERIVAARGGAPMPCAVFDKTGQALPFDLARFDIKRFDLSETNWPGQFRAWLDASLAPTVSAAR